MQAIKKSLNLKQSISKLCMLRNFSVSPNESEEFMMKMAVKDTEMKKVHYKINVECGDDYDAVRRRRMIYRSKQRGWLEVDVLMGSWATQFVPTLNAQELDDYDELLKIETVDIFNYIIGKDDPPAHLKDLSVMKKLQHYSKNGGVEESKKYKHN